MEVFSSQFLAIILLKFMYTQRGKKKKKSVSQFDGLNSFLPICVCSYNSNKTKFSKPCCLSDAAGEWDNTQFLDP